MPFFAETADLMSPNRVALVHQPSVTPAVAENYIFKEKKQCYGALRLPQNQQTIVSAASVAGSLQIPEYSPLDSAGYTGRFWRSMTVAARGVGTVAAYRLTLAEIGGKFESCSPRADISSARASIDVQRFQRYQVSAPYTGYRLPRHRPVRCTVGEPPMMLETVCAAYLPRLTAMACNDKRAFTGVRIALCSTSPP